VRHIVAKTYEGTVVEEWNIPAFPKRGNLISCSGVSDFLINNAQNLANNVPRAFSHMAQKGQSYMQTMASLHQIFLLMK
jgi:hypothetical protein